MINDFKPTKAELLIAERIKAKKRKKRYIALVLCLCALIAAGTSFAFVMPASTQSQPTYCGKEEHKHTNDCYSDNGDMTELICGMTEGEVHAHTDECYSEDRTLLCTLPEGEAHTHTDACYVEEPVLICEVPESDGHTHSAACYAEGKQLTCTLAESAGHVHDASCYRVEQYVTCGVAEGEGAHTHGDGCYDADGNLICNLAESAGHMHDDGCYTYENVLSCGMAEGEGAHTHSDACYVVSNELICGLPECEPHHHNDTCYSLQRKLICGQAELQQTHYHTDDCYQAENVLTCTLSEEPHVHDASCYSGERVLTCTLEEHEHTLTCFADITADIENPEIWERPFKTMEFTGNWVEDVIAVAKTQLGYLESAANYIVDEFDETKIHGYTRYGAWYGLPYSEWCAMFCSFVYHYAGVDKNVMPIEFCGCRDWIEALDKAALWHPVKQDAAYVPQPGDLIFFDTVDDDDLADHVGLVLKLNSDIGMVTTIEGNRIAAVDKFDYYLSDATILGYGHLPENPDADAAVTAVSLECTCGAAEGEPHEEDCPLYVAPLECTCGAPEGEPHAADCPVALWQAKQAAEAEALAEAVEPACTCGAADGQPHAKECPLYVQEPVEIRSAPASDGAVAVITGILPEGAEATIEAVTLTGDELAAIFGEKRAAAMKSYVAYDIKIMVNGVEWQPDESVSVVVEHPAIAVEAGESFGVAHIDSETEVASTVKAEISVDGNVTFDTASSPASQAVVPASEALAVADQFAAAPALSTDAAPVEAVTFEADGFSIYVLYTFTVDFHFGDITFCMEGRSQMLLSELFAELGILNSAADVYKVTFSNPELLTVEQVENDWLLTSLEAFDTNESLYIEFNDGTVLIIAVTDAQNDAKCWKKVSSDDEIVNGGTYLFVTKRGQIVGLKKDNSTLKSASANFTSISGHDGYYTCSLSDSNFYWEKNKDGFKNTGRNCTLNYTLEYKSQNALWALKNRWGKYIKATQNNDGTYSFSSVDNYDSENGAYSIYKLVDMPQDDPGGGTADIQFEDKAPDHFKRIDYLGDDVPNPDTDLDDNLSKEELTDLYRLYLDVGPEAAYSAVDICFIIDRSTSMSAYSGNDATDILGKSGVWRKDALNSLLNGISSPGEKNPSSSNSNPVLKANGLISNIYALNPNNKIAVGAFCNDSSTVYSWRDKSNATAVKDQATQGTNYVAALNKAISLLTDNSVVNDGRDKILIFMSDGEPTEYTDENGKVADVHSTTDANVIKYTKNAVNNFNTFKSNYKKDYGVNLTVYTVGMGKFDATYLNQISSFNATLPSTDFRQILTYLDSAVTRKVGHYTDLSVEDTLSAYVDFYYDDLDLKVDICDRQGKVIKNIYDRNTGYIDTTYLLSQPNGVILNSKDKKVTVNFQDDYQEEGDTIYRLSFNVKTTQYAYDQYAENLKTLNDGYADVTGEEDTDFSFYDQSGNRIYNSTSSKQGGFYSNTEAYVSYRQKLSGLEATKLESSPYQMPVVQVSPTELTVKKVWEDGADKHSNDTITVKILKDATPEDYKDENVETALTLNASGNWEGTVKNLAKGHTYSVVEEDFKNYEAEYTSDQAGTVHTITNKPLTVDVEIYKANEMGNVLPVNNVTFALYEDEDLTEPVNKVVTQTDPVTGEQKEVETDNLYSTIDGKITLQNLEYEKKYWITETVAPDGYNLMEGAQWFKVEKEVTEQGITNQFSYPQSTTASKVYLTYEHKDLMDPESENVLKIYNYSGYELPETGGTGAAPYYISGILFTGFALIYGCILRKRERRAKD